MASSFQFHRRMQAGDKAVAQELRACAAASKLAFEKEELDLLIAISELREGKLEQATKGFARLHDAKMTKAARAARCYSYLLKVRPDGSLDGSSLADYRTFLGACQMFADAEAGRADKLVKQAAGMNVLTLPLWREAWGTLERAQAFYGKAAMLDAKVAAKRRKLIDGATRTLAAQGVRLLGIEAEKARQELMKALGGLRRSAEGEWGPARAVAQVNARIASIQKIKGEMGPLAASACGQGAPRDPAMAALTRAADEADCLKTPKTADGKRLHEQLAQLFTPVTVRPTFVRATRRYVYPDYRLLRLRPIPLPR